MRCQVCFKKYTPDQKNWVFVPPHIKCPECQKIELEKMQTYAEYLQTMEAYHFIPMKEPLWRDWQIHYHGFFKELPNQHLNTSEQEYSETNS